MVRVQELRGQWDSTSRWMGRTSYLKTQRRRAAGAGRGRRGVDVPARTNGDGDARETGRRGWAALRCRRQLSGGRPRERFWVGSEREIG
jgi:hypothetical protein